MKKPLVYIVDDDEAIRDAFRDVLHEFGYEVHAYQNGREAVDALARAERPSVILLDWMMPVMNGSEFVRQPGVGTIPVVVISAMADSIDHVPNVRELMGKPLNIHELLSAVERNLAPAPEAAD